MESRDLKLADPLGEPDVESVPEPAQADEESLEDTARVPRITRLPEGIEVLEERMGLATGQWILEVRCECGRRWFELEEVGTARCPRCNKLVRVKVENRGPA